MNIRHLSLIGLVLALGCGDSTYAPVSGHVTLDGAPLANAAVLFQPMGEKLNPGPGSSARTNENGDFTLEVIGLGNKGAVIGKHRVEIHPTQANPEGDQNDRNPGTKVPIPFKYNRLSDLKFEVKPGPNKANWDLKSK